MASSLPRRGSRLFKVLIFATLTIAGLLGALKLAGSEARPKLYTHVTIYLEPPILEEGGAVIVSGVPTPVEAWRKIAKGNNPASDDQDNPKRQQVGPEDRHFGAMVSSPVTIVEFPYPEGGSYTFNFLPAKPFRERYGGSLKTEMVLSGSGWKMTDPETKRHVDWPSMETIAVIGSRRDQAWARLAKATFTWALHEGMLIERYEGVRTMAMTPEQIARHVVESK